MWICYITALLCDNNTAAVVALDEPVVAVIGNVVAEELGFDDDGASNDRIIRSRWSYLGRSKCQVTSTANSLLLCMPLQFPSHVVFSALPGHGRRRIDVMELETCFIIQKVCLCLFLT